MSRVGIFRDDSDIAFGCGMLREFDRDGGGLGASGAVPVLLGNRRVCYLIHLFTYRSILEA